ncbi:MAG: hypothetical protein IJX34_02820 [Clostridia bacterium]|nr:hypothetical protein [Clostridia bacterium]
MERFLSSDTNVTQYISSENLSNISYHLNNINHLILEIEISKDSKKIELMINAINEHIRNIENILNN